MNGFNVMFTKSTDHGATWSTPVKTYGKVSWNDKPILAVSDNGNDVYVSLERPDRAATRASPSPTTPAPRGPRPRSSTSTRYFFAFDGDVLPNGTVVFSEASLDYGGPGSTPRRGSRRSTCSVRRTTAPLDANVVDTVELGPDCTARRLSRRLLPRPQRDQRPTRTATSCSLRRRATVARATRRLRAALDRRRRDLVARGSRCRPRAR